MLTLGLDTAGDTLAIGLIRDGLVVADWRAVVPQAHSRLLPALLEKVFDFGGIQPRDIELVAVAAGPGSYTGLRLGAMVAKMTAWWARCPVVGVDTMQVLAAPLAQAMALGRPGHVPPLAVLLPSRRGRVYGRLYRAGDAAPEPAGDLHEGEAAQVAQALAAEGAGSPLVAVGAGRRYRDAMDPWLPRGSRWADPGWDLPQGSWVARLGAAQGEEAGTDPVAFVPRYPGPGVAPLPAGAPRSDAAPGTGGPAHGEGAH
ncbi:MAG TPA: tRNA (adenosine(37)-N6)-threonylcarbamoyltransferase complex dimerization subunit type 1 TsaB [Sphingobacteriaceae bacterium]|nr:tRNA (adenosine(37)-N6)-threonylcarbamoyltransferase complex dimerization subunit type 1 TsaB [Sphingobacteriaceae bacterium]